MRFRGLTAAAVITLGVALSGCSSGGKTTAATVLPTTSTSAPPTIVYPATNLQVSGFSPGVNQAPFYPTVTITSVTCATIANLPTVTVALPPGGSFKSATSLVLVPGKAEVRDHAGKALYRELKSGLAPTTHGSVVLSMSPVATTDTDGQRVPAGAFDASGSYLCP